MDPIQNNPFTLRIAKAYGVGPRRAVVPVQPVAPTSPVSAGSAASRAGTGAGGVNRTGTDSVELSGHIAARQRIASLVAARVSGLSPGLDFTVADDGVLVPGEAGALQLHRRPEDLNAAATGVTVGRMVDIAG